MVLADSRLRVSDDLAPRDGTGERRALRTQVLHIDWAEGQLEFKVDTSLGRVEWRRQAVQVPLVMDLVRSAEDGDRDVARALHHLLLPVAMEGATDGDTRMVLDRRAAGVPWELLEPFSDTERPPACVRFERLRQLKMVAFDPRPQRDHSGQALVIGEPNPVPQGYSPLPGARKEAQEVIAVLRQEGLRTTSCIGKDALTTTKELLRATADIVHIAAHGEFDADDPLNTGVILSDGHRLTAREFGQMPFVPRLVFVNCCHLARPGDAPTRWTDGRFGAALAEELLARGVEVLLAAGWPVNDRAARTFAGEFYRQLLKHNEPLGEAVRLARLATFREQPRGATWGAYQVYGHADFRWRPCAQTAPAASGSARRADPGTAAVREDVAPKAVLDRAPPAGTPVFRLEMFPAKEGDALLLTYGVGDALRHVLVDAGRKGTYKDIRQRMLAQDLSVELFVLTHVDADHIEGAVPLLMDPLLGPERIREVWFNGWGHLAGRRVDPHVRGAQQGEYFGAVLRSRGYEWNRTFDYRAVGTTPGTPLQTIELDGGLRLTVLGPPADQRAAMREHWETQLEAQKKADKRIEPGDWERALEVLADERLLAPVRGGDRKVDTSIPNASSIALLAEYGDWSVLLSGDAWAPDLVHAIQQLQQERGLDGEPLTLNAFKLPHHGSAGNVSPALVQAVDCPRWLVSTNGSRHHHPDVDAIERVIAHAARPQLVFNYRSDENEGWDDQELQDERGFTAVYPAEGEDGVVVDLTDGG